ncbi:MULTISPECIES: hypothetical protein [unclassified Streptomyces]|uniref:hypothetical protein n=1 Tax=unclassified Streptomyces TaxID=2593676 RepID=UPI00224D175E|nr:MULTISPECIES: hypothetical protein [unclassified Streptomyces]MCX4808068.1 hypothetical protein [Streptomyces sp. NBC_01214]
MLTSNLSAGQWWIAALVSGLALGLAAQSMTTTPRDRLIAWSLPLVGAVSIAGGSAARGYAGRTPLVLYTATMIILVILRIVFAGYVTRQLDLKRAGKPMEDMSRGQTFVFLLAFLAALIGVAYLI